MADLVLHEQIRQRNACLAGWWAGISFANARSKERKTFNDLYPDPLKASSPLSKASIEGQTKWEAIQRAKGFVPIEELRAKA